MRDLDDIFGGFAVGIGAVVGLYLLLAFVLIYFAADRQSRLDGGRDPALGARVLVGFLFTIAAQSGVLGIVLLVSGVVSSFGEIAVKLGLGLAIGGAVAGVLPLVLRSRIPELSSGAPDLVSRKVWGVNAFMLGIASTFLLIGVVTSVIMGAKPDVAMFTTVVIYTVAAFVSGFAVSKSSSAAPVQG